VPYIQRPRKASRPVRNILKPEQKATLQLAVQTVQTPLIPGIEPPEFWRSLFTWLDNVGMRIGTSLQVTWSMLEGQILTAPAEILKGRDDQQFWVNRQALEAAERIRTHDLRLFPYPHSLRHFHRQRRKLFEQAGIDGLYMGCHGFRAALATKLMAKNPWAAQRQLGHRSLSTTNIYTDVEALREVLESD